MVAQTSVPECSWWVGTHHGELGVVRIEKHITQHMNSCDDLLKSGDGLCVFTVLCRLRALQYNLLHFPEQELHRRSRRAQSTGAKPCRGTAHKVVAGDSNCDYHGVASHGNRSRDAERCFTAV